MRQKLYRKLPEILVILFCMILLSVGIGQKEGFHMDELLSFELANAEYNPWIVPTQPEGRLAKFVHNEIDGANLGETLENLGATLSDVLQNRGQSKLLTYKADVYEEPVWISAEQFTDYITVDGTDDFNYLSVYFNVKDDNHPPLHFMLLHTISSLFRGYAEPVMGCVLNLLFVAGTMILLMKCSVLLASALGMESYGRFLGLCTALLYGCSTGAMATVLLIRMYGLVTFLCVALFYIHLEKWLKGAFQNHNKWLIAVTVLGFVTQYFFLFYCLILAAVTAVLLWLAGRKKELAVYVRSMVTAAVIGVVLYPFAISDVFSSGRGVEALENLSAGLSGYGSRIAAFAQIIQTRTFRGGMLAILLMSFIGWLGVRYAKRHEKKALVQGKVPAQGAEPVADDKARNKSVRQIWVLLCLPVAGYFLLAARMSPYLVDRYIMPLFPFMYLIGILLVFRIGTAFSRYVDPELWIRYCMLFLVTLQLYGLFTYDGTYLYRGYGYQRQLASAYRKYPCICVYDGVGYYENLQEFTRYEKTLLVTLEELRNRKDVTSVSELQGAVVLIKGNVDELEVCSILQDQYGLVFREPLLSDSVYGDEIYLFGREADR